LYKYLEPLLIYIVKFIVTTFKLFEQGPVRKKNPEWTFPCFSSYVFIHKSVFLHQSNLTLLGTYIEKKMETLFDIFWGRVQFVRYGPVAVILYQLQNNQDLGIFSNIANPIVVSQV
jgi:hypothetical protein